jgi:hypothetical protein
MNGSNELTLCLQNANELLRLPGLLYRKRTLKADAEEFIVGEAEAFPRNAAINIIVQVDLSGAKYKDEIATAIHRHFCYRREQAQKKFKRVLQYGWRILFIALASLAVIFSLTQLAYYLMPSNKVVLFIRESFVILGWVVLWRPLELLLYDRYPIKTEINLYYKLERSNVQVIVNES